ncbi:MAG: amidohydrolase family protein [Myxococcota bacterium]|nr:amidohydrolase family protein [Myxococcota bacterium]
MSNEIVDPSVWLSLVVEEIIDPERPIVDPHHHLWRRIGFGPYLLEDLWLDTNTGHNVVKTVFMECGAEYLDEGPKERLSLGEVDFVVAQADDSQQGGVGRPEIAALVSHADLRLGDALEDVLSAHAERSQGLFRGVRHAGACDDEPALMISGRSPADLYADPEFRRGVALLGKLGHTYDTWHYHPQNPAFAQLARAVPDTVLVLDHFGTPLGVGRYAGKREEIFEQWKKDVAEIAECPNVVAKLGGMAMPDNGFGWMGRELPPSSDEFVEAQGRYYLHMLECFGPERCMFESNFPVDKLSIAYPVLWNGLKKIVQDFSEDEKDALFQGTATRVYRL